QSVPRSLGGVAMERSGPSWFRAGAGEAERGKTPQPCEEKNLAKQDGWYPRVWTRAGQSQVFGKRHPTRTLSRWSGVRFVFRRNSVVPSVNRTGGLLVL